MYVDAGEYATADDEPSPEYREANSKFGRATGYRDYTLGCIRPRDPELASSLVAMPEDDLAGFVKRAFTQPAIGRR